MTKGSDALMELLCDAKAQQEFFTSGVAAAERELVKRRAKLAEIDAEVRSLEADLAALNQRSANRLPVGENDEQLSFPL